MTERNNELGNFILAVAVRILLRDNKCQLIFVKNDGSERTAIATTNSNYLNLPHSEARDEENPGDPLIRFYDLEKDAWRSFRLERLINIKPLEPLYGQK